MSVNSSMTAIADKIRSLLGLSGKMGLDAMATNLGTEQTNVANAFTAISNKGGTVPSSKVSGNLASAINSIPSGVTVQRASGTFTTNNGSASANCNFQPDAVVISYINKAKKYCEATAIFSESSDPKYIAFYDEGTESPYGFFNIERTSRGFSISNFVWYADDWTPWTDSDETYNYTALKYTE